MKMQTVLATVVFAGMASVSSLTYAEGELDNFWFNTRIKTTIKKNHGAEISGGFPPSSAVFNKNPIQFDSGKDNCYSALKWQGEHTRRYSLIAICKDSAGDFKNYTSPDEDVQSVEYDDGSILFIAPSVNPGSGFTLPQAGQLADSATKGISFGGSFYFKTSLTNAGDVKTVKLLTPVDGSTIYFEQLSGPAPIIGTSGPGLTMKLVDPDQVPQGAKDCLASVLGTGPQFSKCEHPST